jgi:plastocyanin
MSDHPGSPVEPRANDAEEADEADRPRLPGVAYPVIGMLFAGALVWSFSRVLLAASGFHFSIGGWKVRMAPKDVAVSIALFTAANVLIGAALVAYGRRVRGRTVALPLLVVAAVVVLVAGGVGLALGDRPGEAEAGGGPPAEAITVVASGLQFDKAELTLTADAHVSLTLQNQDAGIQHNLSIYQDESAQQPIFQGEIFEGPATKVYAFTETAPPGHYYFHCDVHPQQMHGTVTVVPPGAPGGGEGPGGGGPGGALDLTAKGIAFQPTTLTAQANTPFTIHFTNDDPSTPHNVAIFGGADASAPSVFQGEVITGPASADYSVDALPPGSYFFHCDVHPQQMTGTITVPG